MIVMVLDKAAPALRGELTRWLLEPRPGVFVGHVNAMVRDRLWLKCCQSNAVGGILQIWNTNNEQRFAMRQHGDPQRTIIDLDGMQLICIPELTSPSPKQPKSTPGGPSAVSHPPDMCEYSLK